MIGGSKGHVQERIEGHVLELFDAFRWKMIPKCTGRYTCRDHSIVSHLTPRALLAKAGIVTFDNKEAWQEYSFQLQGRNDLVLVVPLDAQHRTGIITYVKEDGEHYVHTINAPSGFQRKLKAIGITSLSK